MANYGYGKSKAKGKGPLMRHNPLFRDMKELADPGPLSRRSLIKPRFKSRKRAQPHEEIIPEKLSRQILNMSREQRAETAAEEFKKEFRGRKGTLEFVVEEDVELLPNEGQQYFNPEMNISKEEMDALNMFMPTSQTKSRNLADIVMAKILEKQKEVEDLDKAVENSLDPEVVSLYRA